MRRNVLLLFAVATLVGASLSGCNSEGGDGTVAPPAKVEGARNEPPPEAQAAMKKAQDDSSAAIA
jgi:hypothetical protein